MSMIWIWVSFSRYLTVAAMFRGQMSMKEVDEQMLQIQVGHFWEVHEKREEIVLQIDLQTKQSHQSNSRMFNKIYSTT